MLAHAGYIHATPLVASNKAFKPSSVASLTSVIAEIKQKWVSRVLHIENVLSSLPFVLCHDERV